MKVTPVASSKVRIRATPEASKEAFHQLMNYAYDGWKIREYDIRWDNVKGVFFSVVMGENTEEIFEELKFNLVVEKLRQLTPLNINTEQDWRPTETIPEDYYV